MFGQDPVGQQIAASNGLKIGLIIDMDGYFHISGNVRSFVVDGLAALGKFPDAPLVIEPNVGFLVADQRSPLGALCLIAQVDR